MIPVDEALERIMAALATHQSGVEDIPLSAGHGRVLAEDLAARVMQPPAALSAMDGWAVRAEDITETPAQLRQVGYVPAGALFEGSIGPGEAVRVFTGAPIPDGADAVVMQEDVDADGDQLTIRQSVKPGKHVRAAGLDFTVGQVTLKAGRILTARDLGLAAAMNHAWLRVRRRPRIGILATGSEIVRPGDPIGPAQIISSNSFALAALITSSGGEAVQLGIAIDDDATLRHMVASASGLDMLVTTGGASVGDHDLIRSSLGRDGLTLEFWKIAMRPGKPLIFGQLRGIPLLGLPGNPVSTLVCSLIFLKPAIHAMLGLPPMPAKTLRAKLTVAVGENDRRRDYLRAEYQVSETGERTVQPFASQDSSMVSVLSAANCLLIREPFAPALEIGAEVDILPFEAGSLPE
jgi:molybdopterin molybdotransferase